jgi:hypothetical protein
MMMSGSSVTHRIESIDERAEHVLQALGQADRQSERNRDRGRGAVAEQEFSRADPKVVPEISVVAELPAGLHDLSGRGDEQRIDKPAAGERLPRQQQREQRAAADRQPLVREVKPRRQGTRALAGVVESRGNGHREPGAKRAL